MEQQADLIAFDRSNHMGISKQTVDSIKKAITSEAAKALAPGGASSVINIKENEDRVKHLKVGGVEDLGNELQPLILYTLCRVSADLPLHGSSPPLQHSRLIVPLWTCPSLQYASSLPPGTPIPCFLDALSANVLIDAVPLPLVPSPRWSCPLVC